MEEFRIVLADACKIVKESSRKRVISGADEDGRVMVEFSEPVGGRRVKMLTPEEINGMLYKEETSESPVNAEEAMAEETEPPTAGQEESGESALERIPKDAQTGEPQYTQTDADTAWDALVEQCGGDADMAQGVADSMVKDMETALKKAEKSAPAHGVTVAEKIAAAKGHKAAVEKARTELEKWRAIAGETASRARAAEEAERRRKKERLDAAREELRRNGRYAKEDAALGDYTDFADYAMRTIATGKYRFLWGDRESGTQGLGAHLGFTGSRTERNKRIWLLSKDGFTPEEAAERMLADYSAAAGFDSVGDTGVDSMEALDVILDVLRRYTSPRAMMDDAKAAHAENGESAEERRQGEEYERGQFMEAYHMTPEEYYEYENEWLPRYMEEAAQVPQEVIDNINAEYAEKYSENGKDDYNGGEDGRGVPPVQGERLDKPGGDEGGGDTGGAAGAVGEGDAAGGFVPQGASGREVRAGEVPQPVGKGAFGDIYDQFRGDAKAAFDFLTKHRSGDLLGVFHRDDTGDIDLVWGDENSGLSHILTKHVGKGKDFGTEQAAFDKIESILKNGKLIQDGRLRYVVSEDGYRVAIRKDYDGVKKNWIVTAVDYNRSKEEKEITTNPTSASHGANGPELAAPNNSKGKVTEESADLQENGGKDAGGKAEMPLSEQIDAASAEVNTEPTEAQKEAGNYKKGHVQVGAFDITIEQPEGSIRRGTDADGKQWESKMHNTYGYFRGTEGVDGDHIDVFLSNDMDGWNGAQVFVVDQYNPDGTFDEHKVMLGFNDASDAKNNYLANYEKGWENGRRIDVSAVSLADFEKWIASSHRKTKPFSEYKSVKPADDSETFKGHKVENSGKDIEVQIKHLEEIKDYPGADKKIVQSEIDRLKAKEEAKAKSKSEEVKSKSKEENGVDDAKIDAVLEALSKGDEKAEQLVQGLTSRELSKLRSKVKASPLLENEWQHRVRTRGDVSLHDWLLENQYVEPVKRVSGTFRITDYTAPKDSLYAERLGGVFHDNSGFAVATDGRILVADKGSYDPKLKGKVIGKDGAAMENKFPDWQKVIPVEKRTKSSLIDVEDLHRFVAGVLKADKHAYISLRFPDGTTAAFNADRLNLMLRAMKRLGADKLLYAKDGTRLVAKSDKGAALLIWRVSAEDESMEEYGYAYPGNTVLYHRGEVVREMSPGERVLRDAVIDRLRESGMEVITDEEAGQRVLDEANGKAKLSAKKRRALETVTIADESTNNATAISSADGAKIQKNLETLAENYNNRSNRVKGFITDLSQTLNLEQHEASHYGTFETKDGKLVTIRVSNHNARVSLFDENGEDDGISIVISSHKNKGLLNDGDAHIVEYFYPKQSLERADSKPLSDIIKSVSDALNSGKFEDTTGLAQRQEVNGKTIREHRVWHGSEADFETFDHSHMGEGEGSQAFGWGTYVTNSKDIGFYYATRMDNDPSKRSNLFQHSNGTRFKKKYPTLESFLQDTKRMAINGKVTEQEKIDYYHKMMKLAEPYHNLYAVEIPEDNGKNYLDWDSRVGARVLSKVNRQLEKQGKRSINPELSKRYKFLDGNDLYRALSFRMPNDDATFNDDKAASEFLYSLGFVGIKYKAGRNFGDAKEGATNYVIFNEKDAKITDHVRFFRTADGEAYGFTVCGKIYIDPKIANTETPIHEYAHLWAAALRGQNPKEWRNIVELMKGTSVWDEVKKRYPELNTDNDIADEVLATYSGRRGAERLREEQRKIAGDKGGVFEKAEAISALERVKQALRKFWKSVADFLHIHYKSAEEVADRVMKDLLDGVDPGKHFNSRNDAPRFMFAGEKGAARADRGEEALTRQNNRDVAQKMEAAKKEAKAIKLATGWERGADGKWRYEIPDGIYHPKGDAELKKALAKQPWSEELIGLSDRILDGEELSKEETERFNELSEKEAAFKADYLKKEKPHLADWLENDELFKAYPELKRVGIVFTDNMPKEQAGYYDSKSNTITVNTNSSEGTASIIAHEVQHAIQRYEGFATGGNLKAAMEYLSGNKRADVKIKQQLAYKLSQEKGLGLSEEEVNSLISHLEYEDISDDELQKQIEALCQKHNITEDQLEDIYPMDSVWHEAYNRISGETEARNVQRRMSMTAEERRASLAADTEDVARDSQILLFDDTGKNMSLESPKEDDINAKFNIRLAELVKNPDQKDKVLHLGRSSKFLTDGGLADAEIILEFDKLAHKSKEGYKHEHPFDISDIKDLPKAISSPIAVFDNTNGKNDGRVILTELKKDGRNFIVAVKTSAQNRRGGIVLEINQITTLFPKDAKGIVYWFNSGKATNIDKEKALRFIEALPNHPGTTIKEEELFSAAKVVENFEKTKLSEEGGIEKIIADAKEKSTYMLAPNGKKSNLNERQWAQVRTKAFKNWFGDWESDPENSSKVVDENGEPLVVDGLFLNLKESPLPKMKKAFLRAKELAEMGRKAEKDSGYQRNSTLFAYSEEGDAFLEEYMHSSDSVKALCDCLMDGYTPKPVVAFRYGEIRENQRSYNYRDNILEKGVSVVGKVSEMNTKKSGYYDAFFGGSDYNIVIGYDINESGADGEMLLTKANVIGKAKDMARIVKSATENSGKFSNEEDDIRYRTGEKKELRDGRKIEFVRKPTATYSALARHLQAEGIKPDMHEARTGSRYMSFEKDGVQWEVRSSDHTKPEYYGEAQKPVELTYYKDKQGEENLSVSVDLGTSGYNIESMKALMAEIDRLKNDAGEVKESFDRGVASNEVVERYPLLSQALGVKSENEVRAKEEARKHAEEARKQEMRSAVEDMAGKLHLNNVDIVDKPAGRGAGRRERAKGMFERSTGRITINTGNCADKRDAVVTLLHEAVAHHGLRKLFGENFETFLDNVYNSANAEIRRIIDKHSSRYGGDKRTATEEYMASLAERTDFENAKKSGWWQRIKDFFLKMLEKIGLKGFKSEDLSDNELRYVLWRSYENLKSGGKDTVFSAADDLAKQSELKVGEFAPDAKAEGSVAALNTRFNNELQQQIDGNLPSNHIYQMGNPGKILLSTGVPDLPIQMKASRLKAKATSFGHDFNLGEVKNLVKALQEPLAVFVYGDKTKAQNIIVPLQKGGKNFIVGLSLNPTVGGRSLEINSIRNVFPKDNSEWLNWISQGKALYLDKEKIQTLIAQQRTNLADVEYLDLDSAAKVVENFENPKPESKNDILFRDGAAKDYEKAQARETYERRVSTGMFQSREAIQDSMLSLKVAMGAIEEATAGEAKRIEDYDGFENAYLGENRLSSVNQAESAAFAHLLIRPMMEEVNRLAPTAEDRAELIDYMFAKHGLERNAYMRQQAAEKKLAEYKKQNPGTAKTAADFIDAERDYAGLTTLTGEADVSAAEAEAQRMVADYENDYTFHGTWNEIYVCRKKIC